MTILHTKVYFTVHKQTKLWVKEVERERATWYLGSSKSWFTKSYLIFFSLPAFKGWKDSKSSSQQPAGACYPIQPQPHTVILPKWIPKKLVYFRHRVTSVSKKFVVNTIMIHYWVYYEFLWNRRYVLIFGNKGETVPPLLEK